LPGRPGTAKRFAERGVRIEVERVQARGGRFLADERIGKRDPDGSGNANLLCCLDFASLCGGDARNPPDRRDLGPCERHARVGGEGLRLDRRRSVVRRADALQCEHGCCGALFQRRGCAAGALPRLVPDVVLLGVPERQRQGRGRERAEEEAKGRRRRAGIGLLLVFGLNQGKLEGSDPCA